jgi:outer membrane protein assembly factor BamE (lipoprotein component of BamABCDE complex)
MKKLYTSLTLIAAILIAASFSGCSITTKMNPADMKYKKHTVNNHKSMKKMKLKKCNNW